MSYIKKLTQISKEISSSLKKSDKIDIMLLMGGISEGFADKYSDIDTICYCNDNINVEEIKDLLKKHNYKFIWIDNRSVLRIDINYKDKKITTVFFQTSWLKRDLDKYIKKNKITPRDFGRQRYLYNFVGISKILFDKLNIVKKHQNSIKKEVIKKFKEYVLYDLTHLLNYNFFIKEGAINTERKRNNPLYVSYIFSESLEQIYKIIYALNDAFFISPKWVYKYITKFKKKPKNCVERLKIMSKMETKEKTIDKKIELFREFILDLKKIMEKEGVKNIPEYKIY